MSWPLASFAVVAAVLGLGWLAYERSRPSARMLAVVASLSALTALGRDAFVALPDVKPITAMTLATGYALGPLPGFTVGALGMLASNILLGEGPYTPWQMVAWGGVGLLGALLGRLTGRRLGRLALACACAVAALCAKEVMNTYVWTLGGVYTPAALLARVGEGLPFDLTDTVSSFIFGLAFAPELARLLTRVRARMQVQWAPAGTLGALLVLVGLSLGTLGGAFRQGSTARAAGTQTAAIPRALAYLESAQESNGGFPGSPGERPSELYSAWATLALASAGRDPANGAPGKRSVLASMRAEEGTLESPADMERTMLALHAAGVSAIRLGRLDLESRLLAARLPDGSVGDQVNVSAFAILALRAAGRAASDPVVQAAARWVAAQQNRDGGFSYASHSGGGAASDVDDTGASIEALVASGLSGHAGVIGRALAYLHAAQAHDGGFPQQIGGEPDAQSTAWAVQGVTAAGLDAEGFRRAGGGASPLSYLAHLQAANGSFRYSQTTVQTPVWVTAEVLPALAGRALPIAPAPASASRSAAGTAGGTDGRGSQPSNRRSASGRGSERAVRSSPAGGGQAAAWMPSLVGNFAATLSGFAREALGQVGVLAPAPPAQAPATGT